MKKERKKKIKIWSDLHGITVTTEPEKALCIGILYKIDELIYQSLGVMLYNDGRK